MKDADLREERVTSHSIYNGKIIHVEKWEVRLPSGKVTQRDIVKHPGAVAILAEMKPDTILMVEQYRTAPGDVLIEIPAGKLESGEDPEVCAKRELLEETGCVAGQIQKVYEFFTSPGFADEYIHLYYAKDLTQGDMQLDEDEFVRVHEYSRSEALGLLQTGAVRDAKTLVGLQWWLYEARSEHER